MKREGTAIVDAAPVGKAYLSRFSDINTSESNSMKTHCLDLGGLAIAMPQGVLFQDLDEEVVLLKVESGQNSGVNEAGA